MLGILKDSKDLDTPQYFEIFTDLCVKTAFESVKIFGLR
jgi:hypothetical protein